MRVERIFRAVIAALGLTALLNPSSAAAIPVFARIYDTPCSTCHTVFPQLNPEGERFRARGFHGLQPDVKPLPLSASLDVPGTLPLAFYIRAGEDLSREDVPGQHDATRTHLHLDYFSLLAGGEIGRHLAFLMDYELVETEPDSSVVETNSLPHQAYIMAHAEPAAWLINLKAGWYELPLGASPDIHRLSARPYLIFGLNACTMLGAAPRTRDCEDIATLGETQIGLELNGLAPDGNLAWNVGVTNGSNNRLEDTASRDLYARVRYASGPTRLGLFVSYSPDAVGNGAHDQTLRLGPDLDFYARQFRVLAQFLSAYDSDPTGYGNSFWYWGGFVESNYRFAPTWLALLRADTAWSFGFDDRSRGGQTQTKRRLWEVTAGLQWSILQELKLVAELTYGQDHEAIGDQTTQVWAATLRVVTAFWPFTPPGLKEWEEYVAR